MASSSRPKLVVENDSFLRLIQVILDPAAPADRFAAFSHFCAHDLPDFGGWLERMRARVPIAVRHFLIFARTICRTLADGVSASALACKTFIQRMFSWSIVRRNWR